jgi:DNA-binding MurR/RpiR family transcriptional regulator
LTRSPRFQSIDTLAIVEQRLPALTGASRHVAETIVRDPWAVLGMTIYGLAEASGVSQPSVTRFCRAVGYPGFRELLQGLAQSLGRVDALDLETVETANGAAEDLLVLATAIANRQTEAIHASLRALDLEALKWTIDAIAKAKRVTILGHGGAHVSAMGIALKLDWAGIYAVAATPDMFSNLVISLGEEDVVIGVSHQGRTRDTIESLRLAKSFGATTIGVSTVRHSPMADIVDVSLSVLSPGVARAGTFLIAYSSLMFLADVLSAAVADRRWNGAPPHRDEVVDWIETNLRVGPTISPSMRAKGGVDPIEVKPAAEFVRRDPQPNG